MKVALPLLLLLAALLLPALTSADALGAGATGVLPMLRRSDEFRTNLGFRLELWNADYLPAARALCEEFNGASQGGTLDLWPAFMHWPASPQLASTSRGR